MNEKGLAGHLDQSIQRLPPETQPMLPLMRQCDVGTFGMNMCEEILEAQSYETGYVHRDTHLPALS